jgi:hypothetical protein
VVGHKSRVIQATPKEPAMSISSQITIAAALVLVLASSPSTAQVKATSTTASKPVTTLSKAAKQTSKPTAVSQDAMAKSVKQRTEKEDPQSATQSTPVSERSYEGCHHAKDSDA